MTELLLCLTEEWSSSWFWVEMRLFCACLLFFLINTECFSQKSVGIGNTTRPDTLIFSDTLWLKTLKGDKTTYFLLVTENPYIWNNAPRENSYRSYYFKPGCDGLEITRVFTGDPHYIDKYPRGILLKDSVYSYSIRFHFIDRPGPFQKVMGFEFSNGVYAFFTFKGNVNY